MDIKKIEKEITKNEAEELLSNPLETWISLTLSALQTSPAGLLAGATKVLMAAFRGHASYSYVQEVKELIDKGKIKNNFFEDSKSRGAFVGVLESIDGDDVGDEEKVVFMKHLSWAILDINSSDKNKIAAYHLMRLAKKLTSMDINVLFVCYDHFEKDEKINGAHHKHFIFLKFC